jgi:hypothetical protein
MNLNIRRIWPIALIWIMRIEALCFCWMQEHGVNPGGSLIYRIASRIERSEIGERGGRIGGAAADSPQNHDT